MVRHAEFKSNLESEEHMSDPTLSQARPSSEFSLLSPNGDYDNRVSLFSTKRNVLWFETFLFMFFLAPAVVVDATVLP